jgi:hypothetical protein
VQVRRERRLGDADALERDGRPARVVEQPRTVAEQDKGDATEQLVERAGVEALSCDAGAQDD